VAALGYPLGDRLSLTQGDVTGLDREAVDEVIDLTSLIETDAAVNPGNSGGPLVDSRGRVLGVVFARPNPELLQGIGLAIPAYEVQASVEAWQDSPSSPEPADCEAPLGPDAEIVIPRLPDDPDAEAIAQTLVRYFTSINSGDYEDAWRLQTSRRRQRAGTLEEFEAGHVTTFNADVELHSINQVERRLKVAHVTFVSFQDPEFGPEGEDCTLWDLDFSMERHASRWLIDRAVGHGGEKPSMPCAVE
jgi:hypothetical protein